MLPQSLYNHLTDILAPALGQPTSPMQVQAIGGGSINQTYRLQLPGDRLLFCKINRTDNLPQLFQKEQHGLQLIAQTGAIAVPGIVAATEAGSYQILVLQWIESGTPDKSFFKRFGTQLAALHQHTQPCFGCHEDNYMGSVPQPNALHHDWCSFFTTQRLQPLVARCHSAQLLTSEDLHLFEKLYTKLPGIFDADQQPALVHGDLWSGNYMCNRSGQPVLIDPAAHYGHPAADLGMTTLFGACDKAFYESYHYHAPLPSNHAEQWAVSNLYPLLVHLLLFGASYRPAIRQTLKAFA